MQVDGDELSHRSERCQRGEPEGHQPGEQGACHHCAERPDEAVPQRHGRARPEGPDDLRLCPSQADAAAYHLPGDEEGGDAGDAPEDAERDGLGPQGVVGCRDDARQLDVDEGEALGQDAPDLSLDRGEISVAVLEGQPAHHVVAATGQEFVREGRREEHDGLAVRRVPVLEHGGRLTPREADQLHPRPLFGGDLLVLRHVPRQRLRVGQPPDGDLLPDVIPERLRAGRIEDDLVGVVRVEHPPPGDDEPVLR